MMALDHVFLQLSPFRCGRPNLRRVQQIVYTSGNPQRDWIKLPDISFAVGGVEGIRLTDAMNPFFDGPDGRDGLMFTSGDTGNSVSCRVIVRASRSDNLRYY